MFCKLTREEAAAVNVISDQAFATMSGAMNAAAVLAGLTQLSPCHKGSALLHAVLNVAITTALAHRNAHDEMEDINSLADLKKNPEAFLQLVGDVNEIFACVCRGIDPDHDYMVNLFKMESKPASGKGNEEAKS